MRIVNGKVNHLAAPLGFQMSAPGADGKTNLVFTYLVEEAAGKREEGSRLVVALDAGMQNVILDTGWAEHPRTGIRAAVELRPRMEYYWTVEVKTDAGEQAVSEVWKFEIGKGGEAFAAQWITCAAAERSPVFVKEFAVADKEVVSARLYMTGLGVYEATLNGARVSDEHLTPYCNNYDEWIQVQTYDVTDLVAAGANTLCAETGDGWFAGRFGYDSQPDSPGHYGKGSYLLVELRVRYADGTEDVFGTDSDCTVRRGNITFSNIYDGEVRDDTLAPVAEELAVLVPAEQAASLTARLSDRYSLPVLVLEELPVREILTTPKGETVLDLGQEITGIFRLHVRAAAGTKIHLQFGEVLQDGNFYQENLRTAKAEYWYTSDGTDKWLEPRFTFYGYRYVKVEGLDLSEADFVGLSMASALEKTGQLTTGHELVNKLISNIEWGCRDNFLDVPTDCPQRDERMGWTADTQVFSPTASYLHDTYAFYRKYLHDLATEQKKWDGGVPYTIPSFDVPAGSSVWGDVATILPMVLYDYTADDTILNEQFESMKAWVEYIRRVDGEDCGWRRAYHFGDWLALDVPGAESDATSGATDEAFLADVYYMYSAELVSRAAEILGKAEDQETYLALAQTLRRRILDEFYSPLGRCGVDTQTGLILTLVHKLAPEERTAKRLREKIEKNHGHLDCGFVGAPLICRTLAEHGMQDLAAKLLLNEEFPGWLHEIHLGATTVWERWNSLDEEGHISSTGMNSLNHYAYGSVLEYLYRNVAGLAPRTPGFTEVDLTPEFIPELTPLSCIYQSASGIYEVSYDESKLHVTVPFGCTAYLHLANQEEVLESGSYTFSY